LHHVNLVCGPGLVPSAAAFWKDVFGLVEIERHGRSGRPGAWLRTPDDSAGSFQIHLSERDEPQSPDAHVAISVDDVASVRERCVVAGAPWEAAEPVIGTARGFTRDPAGNRVEVIDG
jgi:catechol 2,3-dioxygenase-like lactoylglutathione lyase family enzyme